MIVAGVEVATAAVAQLALLLHRAGYYDLAQHLGIAVDTNQRRFGFGSHELSAVLSVLDDPPHGLAELRRALLRAHRRTDRPSAQGSTRSRRPDSNRGPLHYE
jgi:hypothetical protein